MQSWAYTRHISSMLSALSLLSFLLFYGQLHTKKKSRGGEGEDKVVRRRQRRDDSKQGSQGLEMADRTEGRGGGVLLGLGGVMSDRGPGGSNWGNSQLDPIIPS